MMYQVKEWLSIPKEERLMMIKLTVAENVAARNKVRHGA